MSVFDKIALSLPRQVLRNVHAFKRCKRNLTKTNLNIKFNKKCLSAQITPNYIKVKINSKTNTAKIVKAKCEIMWLKTEIKMLYKKKELLNKQLYNLHLQLGNCLSSLQFSYILQYIQIITDKEQQKILYRHKKKLDNLEMKKGNLPSKNLHDSQHQFHGRTINSTNISFTNNELALINKGLKHNIEPRLNANNLKSLIASTKLACDAAKLNSRETNAIAFKANKIITRHLKNTSSHRNNDLNVLNCINSKLSENKALIVKADKSNCAVIMYEKEYVDKTMQFFNSNNITELDFDPTSKFQAKIKKTLKNCNFLLTNWETRDCIAMNPTAPRLRSQPKTHKENCPIRPIVNSRNSPSYKLNNKLLAMLNTYYTFENKFSIKNTYELIDKIKDVYIPPTARFASLDIVNLYTNIPVDDTINIIRNNLLKHMKLSMAEICELLELLTLVLSYNYFSFNNKIYRQKDGLAMGSSLAGMLADIYINHLEQTFFEANSHINSKIIYYKRYVDDTIILFDGTNEEIDTLATKMSSMHKNIKFTVEHETNSSINFLDVKITNKNHKHQFEIYRKPTSTDVCINSSSCHPNQHKMAYFRSTLNRLHKIPLEPVKKEKEISIIKTIASNNGYDPLIIDKLSQKIHKPSASKTVHQTTMLLTQDTVEKSRKYVALPFLGSISYKISNLFKNTNIKISFHTNNKLQQLAVHNLKNYNPPYKKIWHI
ncbi:uncharacterized protein LOC126272518 [Schistocerca gregaria]|uniref:uncharacterized protein LOC126272518 n=1 Tax=Schistocerca gregaria TaxID=7010 RepID=UPI00211DDA3F|nr:uncharacterized protein LOC126272518 [Schistocerca gregaria]